MNFRKISLLVLILLIADQALKIWVKTHMHLDESIVVFPDWFQLRFIENNGAAFGMHIATKGGFDWGKLLLGIFRIVMVGVIGWLMHHLLNKRKDTPKGVIVGLALVMAGALGNIIDSAFYGLLFSESTPYTVAHFGGHYAGFMMGKVVDMFYFPLFQWNGVPRFLNFLVDSNNYFFGAIFNLADAYISVSGACAARRAGSIPVLGTRNPVRVNSDGVLHFLCPHRVRNLSGTTKIETCPWLLISHNRE